MSIQNKVAIALLVILVGLLTISAYVINSGTSSLLRKQARHETRLLVDNAHQHARGVFDSLVIGTRGSVEQGEMDVFNNLLKELAKVHNVLEVGMANPDGVVSYSNLPGRVNSRLESDVFQQARADLSGNVGQVEKGNLLYLTRSQVFRGECLECHENSKVGDLGGVLFLKFDLGEMLATGKEIHRNLEAGLSSSLHSVVITVVVGVVLTIIIIYFMLGNMIRKPLTRVKAIFADMEKGRLDGRLNMDSKDEIGDIARIIDNFADILQKDVLASLQKLASGDLTFDIHPCDSRDSLRMAIKKVRDDLSDILARVQVSGSQISAGSAQVSETSQVLSEGATDSASSLEEISASMNELASQTRTNAENSQTAYKLAAQTHTSADEGSKQMHQMVTAMADINESSLNISKIIKVIDEIAFQTNLLALNAAVEAAHAGQHGKGFAVVAEEVRNLAARSAKAARETSELIENSVSKVEYGAQIADNTSATFNSIVEEIQKVNDLLGEISASSVEQSQGISQINDGVAKIDEVTQQNTASAEQAAAAAQELSNQAMQLEDILRRFKLRRDGSQPTISQTSYPAPPRQSASAAPTASVASTSDSSGWGGSSDQPQIALDDDEFGKF